MKKIIRPGIYALMVYEGKIILIKKSIGPYTGKFDLPGGGIEHNENHISTLQREVKEELGIEKFKIQKIFNIYNNSTIGDWKGETLNTHLFCVVYLCNTDIKPDILYFTKNNLKNDSSDFLIINPLEYLQYDLTPTCKNAIEDYINNEPLI